MVLKHNNTVKPTNYKETKLYNVIFPVWLIVMYPVYLIFVLPANFIIDYLVLRIGAKHLKIDNYKETAKSVIVKTWLLGFASDIVGVAAMLAFNILTVYGEYDLVNAIMYNPFARVGAFLAVVACVLLSAVLIYFLNYKFAFKRLEIDVAKKKRLALYLAIFTAPYLFLLPTVLFIN